MTEKLDDLLNKYDPRKDREDGRGEGERIPEKPAAVHDLTGDPNCPICGGMGYVRLDVPVEDPRFGKLEPCACRQADLQKKRRNKLFHISSLDELEHFRFENFKPRGQIGIGPLQSDSLENAFKKAVYFAESLKGWILFQGSYGCGKTHLARHVCLQS